MNLSRRGFLKLMGVASTLPLVGIPQFVLANPSEVIAGAPFQLGAIRAMGLYDSDSWDDRYIVRLDAYNGRDQFSVDFVVAGKNKDGIRTAYFDNRKIAEEVLRNDLRANGWKAADLIALPVPANYRAPEWMQ